MVDEHPILLRGLALGAPNAGPTIVARTDADFIEAILAELATPAGRAKLARTVVAPTSGALHLFQPVQRVFHVALFEVACDPFGAEGLRPRLDPRKLQGAGMVVRRVVEQTFITGIVALRSGDQLSANGTTARHVGDASPAGEGWRNAEGVIRGWLPFGAADELADPDPTKRRPALRSGVAELDALLAGTATATSEQVTPLFVAPPAVCEALGKTVLYGVMPLASSERSEAARVEPLASSFVRDNLVAHLRAPGREIGLGSLANRTITPVEGATADSLLPTLDPAIDARDMRVFRALVRQVYLELDAFGPSSASQALLAALDTIALPYPDDETNPAGQVLREAARVLVDLAPGSGVWLPNTWPALTATQYEAVAKAAEATVAARVAALELNEGRYDGPGRRYTLRGFARVAHDDNGCPPDLIWSGPSAAFTIAPWYESGPAPLTRIELPNVLGPNTIRSLKPNVAFSVPPELQNLLAGLNAKDLIEGKGGGGDGSTTIEWICSFSIPIITLCAFIVLNIFLGLLNIVFQWMLWVKICIPIPRRQPPPP